MDKATIAIMRYWARMARSALREEMTSKPAQATMDLVRLRVAA